MRKWLVALVVSALIAGSTYGCGGGGGGGGGGGVAPVVTYASLGFAPAVRPDTRLGTAVSASLQDQLEHQFAFPTNPGRPFLVGIDTQPSGQVLRLEIYELSPSGGPTPNVTYHVQRRAITTPFSTAITGATDGTIYVVLFDERQSRLVATVSAIAQQQIQSTTSVTTFSHFCGDSFAGFSSESANSSYNDLTTPADQQRLVQDLLNGVNAIWAQTGVQVDVGRSGLRQIPSAQIPANLIENGRTILDDGQGTTPPASDFPARAWGNLGMPASDPAFGKAIDIFFVRDTSLNASPGIQGLHCGVRLRSQGGVMEGTGPNHLLVVTLFEIDDPYSVGELTVTLAHELGHFLSLMHTTEVTFAPFGGGDDLLDTPLSSLANDTNGNKQLDGGDTLQNCPDYLYLMHPLSGPGQTTLSPNQAAAMRAYLAIREH